jgi:hypothetical protein
MNQAITGLRSITLKSENLFLLLPIFHGKTKIQNVSALVNSSRLCLITTAVSFSCFSYDTPILFFTDELASFYI